MDFDVKLSEYRHKGSKVPSHAMIKNPEQIAAIRESAKINVSVLDYVAEHICAGISTEQIDLWVYEQNFSPHKIKANNLHRNCNEP